MNWIDITQATLAKDSVCDFKVFDFPQIGVSLQADQDLQYVKTAQGLFLGLETSLKDNKSAIEDQVQEASCISDVELELDVLLKVAGNFFAIAQKRKIYSIFFYKIIPWTYKNF